MQVSLKTFAPMIVGGMALIGCTTTGVEDRAKKYFSETGRSQIELNNIVDINNPIETQSNLDSVAYRDIFFATQASKDSANVAEFNKIARKIRPSKEGYATRGYIENRNLIKENLVKEGISVKDLERIEEAQPVAMYDDRRTNLYMHLADDWAYRRFFKKIGIMNNEVSQKCDEVSLKIAP